MTMAHAALSEPSLIPKGISRFTENQHEPNPFYMKSIRLILTLIFLFTAFTIISSQSVIIGKHFDNNTKIKFFPPFEDFSNDVVSERVQIEDSGRFVVPVTHNTPTMAKILIGGRSLSIFLNLYDTIYITITTTDFKKNTDSIHIDGRNSEGIKYFNLVYDNPSNKKFFKINEIFLEHKDMPAEDLVVLLKKELINQTIWLDSLRNKNKIDDNFLQYIKTEIIATLTWGVLYSCNKSYRGVNENLFTKAKSIEIKNSIFSEFPRKDSVLRKCLTAPGFLMNYYKTIYKAGSDPIDSSQVIIYDEFYFLYPAPLDVRKYLLGVYLLKFKDVVPTLYDYCSLFKDYTKVYESGDFVEAMKASNACKKLDNNADFKILNVYETDLNDMISNHFRGERLFIDLWATWCIPCKAEFKEYDDELYSFLKKYKIHNVFISIDKDDRHEIWKKEISLLGLPGYHFRANPKLVESIQQIVFKGDSISIPRYIIVNEEGSIVSFNANRPSSIESEIVNLFGN
jgi:thiol-disulfide isomerase/thioredoxin